MPTANNRSATSFLSNSMWVSVDGPSTQDVVESLTSLKRMRSAEPPSVENRTIATDNETTCERGTDDESYEVSDARGRRKFLADRGSDGGTIPNSCGVPSEVTLLENDNDDSNSDHGSEWELEGNECGVQSDDEYDNNEDDEIFEEYYNEHKENHQMDEDRHDDGSAVECEADEDNVESERSEGDEDEESMADPFASSEGSDGIVAHGSRVREDPRWHELFLPRNISPSIESLKYEEDDESSDDDDDEPHCVYRTYMIQRGGRPRIWEGCPAEISVSSNSSSSEDGSHLSRQSKKRKKACKKTGVSFSNSVTVYPVFHSNAYPASVFKSMYTKRKELRVIKLRNKKEFDYDSQDWQNATEEEDFEIDDEGELIHPVHCTKKARSVVKNCSLALRGYQVESISGPGFISRPKRMKMHHLWED